MSRELPVLEYGETFFLDNSAYTWRNIPVPDCLAIGKKFLGRKIIGLDPENKENIDFVEFLFLCYAMNIPVDFTEKFLREEIGIRIDVYRALSDTDLPRMELIRIERKRKLMDDIEQSRHFIDIPKTPEEIAYANAITRNKLMMVSRTQREYNISQEQKVEVTGNLAQVIIPKKDEE